MYYTTNIRAAFTFELWMNASTALKFSWDSNHVRIFTLNHRAGKKKLLNMRQSHASITHIRRRCDTKKALIGGQLRLENLQVLDHFAKANSAGMRTNGNSEFGRHQVDGQDLVDAAPSG